MYKNETCGIQKEKEREGRGVCLSISSVKSQIYCSHLRSQDRLEMSWGEFL